MAETNEGDQPGLAITPEGRWLVWAEDSYLVMAKMEPTGKLALPDPLPLPLDHPHAPQLVPTENGLRLFLLARAATGTYRIFVQLLAPDGALLGLPTPISLSEQKVKAYDVVATRLGSLLVWSVVDGGIWVQAFEGQGAPHGPPVLLSDRGEAPAAVVDHKGQVHLVWLDVPSFNQRELAYARLREDATLQLSAPRLWGISTGLGAIFSPPAVALDERWFYAFVSVEYRGGFKQGTSETHVVAFPIEAPHKARAFLLSLPEQLPEDYTCCAEGLNLAPLPSEDAFRSTDIRGPTTIPGQRDHAVIGIAVKAGDGRKAEVQPAVVAFKDGQAIGWCPVARTSGLSLFPQVRPSSDGWHALWLDMHGYGAYRVYYASTAPSERSTLDRLELSDVLHTFLTVLTGFVSGLALIPLFLMAAVPGLLLVVGHCIIGGEGDLHTWTSQTLLLIGLLPYALLKVLFTAGLMPQLPFGQWISSELAKSLAVSLPFTFLAVDALALTLYWRRTPDAGLLPAWALFVGVDIMLTIMVLGPLIAGA